MREGHEARGGGGKEINTEKRSSLSGSTASPEAALQILTSAGLVSMRTCRTTEKFKLKELKMKRQSFQFMCWKDQFV